MNKLVKSWYCKNCGQNRNHNKKEECKRCGHWEHDICIEEFDEQGKLTYSHERKFNLEKAKEELHDISDKMKEIIRDNKVSTKITDEKQYIELLKKANYKQTQRFFYYLMRKKWLNGYIVAHKQRGFV